MTKVCLGDVANERKENCKTNEYNDHIVGLEHLIPQEVTLTQWAENIENTFTKVFHKGDVLFGRRRAYLKKAAVAPFDGICSGDITVIEAKSNKIVPELLPFIIQNDNLFDYAVEKSAGSLSPRVKWSHLQNYEFELPDLNKQRELAELLWAAEETKQAYKNLYNETEILLQAEFNKSFGNINTTPIYRPQNLIDYVDIRDELREPIKDADRQSMKEGNQLYPYYGATGCVDYIDKYKVDFDAICIAEDCGNYNAGEDSSYIISGKCWVNNHAHILKPKTDKCDITFLNFYFKMLNLNNFISGSTRAKLTKGNLEKLKVFLPDFNTQQTFANIIYKSFESKINIANQIETINKIKKEVLTQNLTQEVSHV